MKLNLKSIKLVSLLLLIATTQLSAMSGEVPSWAASLVYLLSNSRTRFQDESIANGENLSAKPKFRQLVSLYNYTRAQERGIWKQLKNSTANRLLKNELSISLGELTEQNLLAIKDKTQLNTIGKLRIYRTHSEDRFKLTANHIALIAIFFPALLELALHNVGMCDEHFAALAKSPTARYLLNLDISRNDITHKSFIADILNNFTSLKKLNAGLNRLGDYGFQELAISRIAPQLVTLIIGNNGILCLSFRIDLLQKFNSLVELFVGNKKCPKAEALSQQELLTYRKNMIAEEGFRALATSNIAPQLRVLDIGSNSICRGFTCFVLDNFTNLTNLRAWGNNFNFGEFIALAQSTVASQLVELDISRNPRIGDLTTRLLNRFRNLKKLNLADNQQLSDDGFEELAESIVATQLVSLNIDNIGISEISFTVDRINKFRNLKELSLKYNSRIMNGLVVLAQSNLASQLRILNAVLISKLTSAEYKYLNNFTNLEQLWLDFKDKDTLDALIDSNLAKQLRALWLPVPTELSFPEFKEFLQQHFPNAKQIFHEI